MGCGGCGVRGGWVWGGVGWGWGRYGVRGGFGVGMGLWGGMEG